MDFFDNYRGTFEVGGKTYSNAVLKIDSIRELNLKFPEHSLTQEELKRLLPNEDLLWDAITVIRVNIFYRELIQLSERLYKNALKKLNYQSNLIL